MNMLGVPKYTVNRLIGEVFGVMTQVDLGLTGV
jgi:hypothetical protein